MTNMNHEPSLLKQLKLWHIVVIGLGYMAPMAVFDTFGIVTESTDGHVSGAYAFTLIAILFTAISYGKMVKAFPGAGSSYTYAQQVMNPSIGFLVGWTALLDYLFLPMINALLTNIYLSSLFPGVPKAVWIISFVVIMTIMNIFSVHLTVSFGTILFAFQILVAIIFIILSATTQGQELSFKPFISESASISLLLNGAAILCFSFLGFDAVTTMAEETLKPEKTIPKGILIIACTGGALFITVSYFAQLLFPSASLFHDLEGASADIASGLVSHMSASRLLYAIGKDGYLPRRIFGYIHPKTKTPVWNVVIIGGLSLISLGLSLEKATSLINFGALIAFSSVNIAVFIHYFIHQNKRSLSGYISYVLMPLLGSLFLFFMWLNLEKTSLFIGIVWSVIGIIYLLIVRRKNTITIPTFHFD